jgi:tight adherence protein C
MENLDSNTKLIAAVGLWAAAILFAIVAVGRWRARERSRRRAWAEEDAFDAAQELDVEELEGQGFLRRWLFLAGYRRRTATSAFLMASIASVLAGVGAAIFVTESGLTARAVEAASGMPGGAGDLARPVLAFGPWIILILFAFLPWSIVNSKRKKRVREIEQDMPVTLELLATMSESGLAFDSALERVIGSGEVHRPLFQELRSFQVETMSGVPRVHCFRRFARRVEVASVSIFASALVQAEQIGSGFTNVLRTQADDLRNRRREDANMLAQALTVKLVFPLVLCFLPGIFVSTLGPVFLQFLKLTNSLTGGR